MKRKLLAPNCIQDVVVSRIAELEKWQKQVKNTLASYPPGKIHISRNAKGRVQHYLRLSQHDKCGKYVRQSETACLKKYLQKSYDEKFYDLIEKELALLKPFGEAYGAISDQVQKIYGTFPEKSKDYIQPMALTNEEFAQSWNAEPFEGKPISENDSSFVTEKGERVRSKSELTIANAMTRKGISYKYECPLQLDRFTTIYPDFTVLNARTRKVYYWEHRGMMDDREYAKHTVKRIKNYQAADVMLGDNLIITEETSATPLGTPEIERIIKKHLI
ncbi:MAG: hypothetical protein Q4B73_09855 [Lachnospiraceae bacterium]|nr:hypothetical protein [Lachnospiraceae bacterium]